MNRFAVLAAFTLAMCGAALAQTEQNAQNARDTAIVEGPWGGRTFEFESRPNGRDFATNYPRAAYARSMGGVVILCCKPNPDRTLGCRVGVEWPTAEWKFGEATLRFAHKFRLTPDAYQMATANPDAELKVPVRWNIEGGSRDRRYEDSLQRASEIIGTAPICEGYRRIPKS